MAQRQWSRHLDHTSLAEDLYWHRLLSREQRLRPWGPGGPNPMVRDALFARAQAIADRYQRMKRHAAYKAKKAKQAALKALDAWDELGECGRCGRRRRLIDYYASLRLCGTCVSREERRINTHELYGHGRRGY